MITDVLVSRADMLEDHFSIVVSKEGYLTALPMLLKGYVPTMDKLPRFLLRLGTEVISLLFSKFKCKIVDGLNDRWTGRMKKDALKRWGAS